MEKVELSLERLLVIWWAFIWRVFLVSTIGGAIFGGIGGILVGLAGHPELGALVGGIFGWLVSIPVTIWALRATLTKNYSDFSIILTKSII